MVIRSLGLLLLLVCALVVSHAAGVPDPDSSRAEPGTFLEREIYNQLSRNRSLRIRGLQVEEVGGEVILRGTVDNYHAWQEAEKSIRNRIGVKTVINLLNIENSASTDESSLAARVRSALCDNIYLGGRDLNVVTVGDTVVLDGIVRSAFEWEQARRTTSSVSGVSLIDNRISVMENVFSPGERWSSDGNNDDPAVRALIDSYYKKQGVSPELSIELDTTTNLAAAWADSLETHPPKAGGRPRVVNPETRYYEAFNFVGAGIYLFKKIFGWDKKKKKEKD